MEEPPTAPVAETPEYGSAEWDRVAGASADRLLVGLRAALAEYDAAPGAKYDDPKCACTWCTLVKAIREAVA